MGCGASKPSAVNSDMNHRAAVTKVAKLIFDKVSINTVVILAVTLLRLPTHCTISLVYHLDWKKYPRHVI